MKRHALVAALIVAATLAACKKHEKTEEAAAPAPAPTAATAAPAAPVAAPAEAALPPGQQTPEQRELAWKKDLLAFGVMEDKYINDPRAQWASDAKASSVFGDQRKEVSEVNMAKNVVGPSDDKKWMNDNYEKGFDWLETGFAKPVNATEVRVVLIGGNGSQAINKVELQDVDGNWHTMWEGISEVKQDRRGKRTWFVRTFDKTAYKAKASKVTFANNLEHEYKTVDAVQLVGD